MNKKSNVKQATSSSSNISEIWAKARTFEAVWDDKVRHLLWCIYLRSILGDKFVYCILLLIHSNLSLLLDHLSVFRYLGNCSLDF